jgi:hypothetical protein
MEQPFLATFGMRGILDGHAVGWTDWDCGWGENLRSSRDSLQPQVEDVLYSVVERLSPFFFLTTRLFPFQELFRLDGVE